MTFKEYQEKARRTQNPHLTREQRLAHALHGLSAEVGELHGIFQKQYQGHPIDEAHLFKEHGDVAWFWAEFCDCFGWDADEVASMNIAKLENRFPNGFEVERSVHRKEGDV